MRVLVVYVCVRVKGSVGHSWVGHSRVDILY